MMNKGQIESDYLYCEKIIKKHSKSFYFAFSSLPKEKAQAVYTVYAFCRFADDSVDENPTKSTQINALNQMEKELALFEENSEIDHPLWRALRDVFNRFNMEIQPFYDQLMGQRMDINFNSPNTLKDLEYYSALVAGSVGIMLLPIIASSSSLSLSQTAIDLGVAMQITNILRDIGEDLRDKNRVYLPLFEIRKQRYSLYELKQQRINDQFINLWERLARHAERLYNQFENHIPYFDQDSQEQVAMSARVYREILNEVRKNNYDCFTKRNFVSKTSMMHLSFSAMINL